MNKILSGIICRDALKKELFNKIKKLKKKITLTVISVGNNDASKIYINNKIKEATSIGITCTHKHFKNTTTKKLVKLIKKLNKSKKINGILVQLPLPANIDEDLVINSISPIKDVDGLTNINMGKLVNNNNCIIPCTAKGIINLLKFYNINIVGKNITIIGRSKLVGIPLFHLLLNMNATVTICHSKTKDLKSNTKNADIVIIAIGKPKFLTADMIKNGSIVIDVGINRINGKICGDVDFDNLIDKVKYITPVPNGVGPMTVFEVLENTILCYEKQNKL